MCRFTTILLLALLGCTRSIPPDRSQVAARIDFANPTPRNVCDLVSLLGTQSPRPVQDALVHIGEPAVPALIDKLRRGESLLVAEDAKRTLWRMGPWAIPPLLEVLYDPAFDQGYVISALGDVRPTSDEAVASLLELLNTPQTRKATLNAIGTIGGRHEAKPLTPAVAKLTKNEDPFVREQARDLLVLLNYEWNASGSSPVARAAGIPLRSSDSAAEPVGFREAKAQQEAYSGDVRQPREITNSIGMRLVLIPPGAFIRGGAADEPGRDGDEDPRHLVRITRGFYLGACEVTQTEYATLMESNPSWFSAIGRFKNRTAGIDTAKFPVEGVSWEMADEYCRRLSSLPDEKAAGRIYRLPTEAEWEYAARAGTTTPFHVGGVMSSHEANIHGRYPYGTSEESPYLGRPTKVGSYSPNAFGLHDMHGNVWEWCSDQYSSTYYANADAVDPVGPEGGLGRVIRGGGWNSFAKYCRSGYRRWQNPYSVRSACDVGFRVAFSAAAD